jgi:hypothetical protein
MQESMTLAGSGKTGEAYSKLMPFLTDPSVARNPFMMPALEAGIKMNQIAADDYLRKSQIEAYNARSTGSGGGGEGGGGFDIQGYVDVLNQGGDATQQEEQVVDQTEVNPMVAGQLPGMRIPAPQNQAGMAAEKNAIDQQAEDQLPTLSQGPTKEAEKAMGGVLPDLQKEPPPKNILEKFIKIEDRFAKLPLDKQRAEMDNTSIIFPNKEDVAAYKSPKGRGVVELSTAAGVGVPGAVAVELPQAVSKYVLSGVNVNPKTGNVSYSINQKEIDKDPNAKSAISWLRDWQEASVKVSNNPQLRDLLAQANNDALEIDIKPLGKNATTPEGEVIEGDIAELTVKGKPETKIQVPADVAKNIEMLQTQTAAANTHNAKFIRLKGEEPAKTGAPAPVEDALSASREVFGVTPKKTATKTQPTPEKLSADNPFAQAVSEKQTQEVATTKQSIETQKTKIQDSISELENKLKILTAVGQRNPEILPDFLRRKMGAYMNATPSRNAKDFEDTKKEIEKLRSKLKSL